jgi:hypothetical protein
MNNNLEKLAQINSLINNLIDNNSIIILYGQTNILILEIKNNIEFLISEYYFINILKFEDIKKKSIHRLILLKNNLLLLNLNHNIIFKINLIINNLKLIFYPAHLNINNNNKYKKEINQIKTVKFYHKPNTIDVKNNFYDYEVIMKDLKIKKNISNNEKYKFQNNKNFKIIKMSNKDFINNIDFNNSYIII